MSDYPSPGLSYNTKAPTVGQLLSPWLPGHLMRGTRSPALSRLEGRPRQSTGALESHSEAPTHAGAYIHLDTGSYIHVHTASLSPLRSPHGFQERRASLPCGGGWCWTGWDCKDRYDWRQAHGETTRRRVPGSEGQGGAGRPPEAHPHRHPRRARAGLR